MLLHGAEVSYILYRWPWNVATALLKSTVGVSGSHTDRSIDVRVE